MQTQGEKETGFDIFSLMSLQYQKERDEEAKKVERKKERKLGRVQMCSIF